MKRYKVLNNDLTSPFRKFQFEFGKKYHCSNSDANINNDCSNGFYATRLNGLIHSFNIHRKVYECEVWGKKIEIDQFEMRYENIELIKEIPHDQLKQLIKGYNEKLGYNYLEAMFPIHPLKDIPEQKKITIKDKKSLKQWDSVWGSVWSSVGNSVLDSIWAYISSLFPNVKKWKKVNHKKGINPFQCAIDLWRRGLVPSFDGKIWRLHTGKDAKIIYEMDRS